MNCANIVKPRFLSPGRAGRYEFAGVLIPLASRMIVVTDALAVVSSLV